MSDSRCARCNYPTPQADLDHRGNCEHCRKVIADKQGRETWTERLGVPPKGLSYAPLAGASGGQYRTVHGIGKG